MAVQAQARRHRPAAVRDRLRKLHGAAAIVVARCCRLCGYLQGRLSPVNTRATAMTGRGSERGPQLMSLNGYVTMCHAFARSHHGAICARGERELIVLISWSR
eukprot:4660103-Pyramimonas_sp.AAC.1